MTSIYAMATKRADDVQTWLGRPMSHDEWEGLVNRLILSTAVEDTKPAKVNIGGLWIQPQVREQSRLPFNIDYNEDLSEWTDERVELESLIGSMPDEGRGE